MRFIDHIKPSLALVLLLTLQQNLSAANFEFVDVHGKKVAPFTNKETKGLVMIFVSHDCPVANGYQPLLRELTKKYTSKGFSFIQVYPDPDLTIEVAEKHIKDFEIHGSSVLDSDQKIAKSVKAKITPEAFLISPQGEILYQGRIDDTWVKYGKKKAEGVQTDLKNAIEDVLAGKPVQVKETKALGCHIFYE